MPEAGSLALVVLPLSLSLDNLAAGVGLERWVSGGGVGAADRPGERLNVRPGPLRGRVAGRWVPRPAELWSGVYLLALAAFRLVRDLA